jgi:hypothetical protein
MRRQCRQHARQLGLGEAAPAQEEVLHRAVAPLVEQHAARGQAVAAGTARLLVVGVQAGRHLVMHDEAQVGLVDAHAEGVGGDHHAGAALHEGVLCGMALGRAQLAVVQADGEALSGQRGVHLLGGAHGGGVDDAGLLATPQHILQGLQLVVGLGQGQHGVVQVAAPDAGIDGAAAADVQQPRDFRGGLGRRGGGQCQHRRLAERAQRRPDLQEGRPKVMAPFDDAVGLVHRHRRDAAAAHQRPGSAMAAPGPSDTRQARHASAVRRGCASHMSRHICIGRSPPWTQCCAAL